MADQPAQLIIPRVMRREAWVDLPTEYPGFKLRVWVNASSKVWNDVSSGEHEKTRNALKKIMLEHNGWRDEDDQPYPATQSDEFWDLIPTELLAVMIVVTEREMGKLPNSLKPKNRR